MDSGSGDAGWIPTGFWVDFGWLLGRFYVNSVLILDLDMLGGCWADSEWILGGFQMDSAGMLAGFWVWNC